MKVYLTGASGYIGKALQKRGYLPLHCDVTNYNFVNREISNTKPDVVLHLAGVSSPDVCMRHPNSSSNVNYNGTWNVVKVCCDLKVPAVFLSSSQIWGGGWQDVFNGHTENSKITNPVNDYGLQKLTAESAATVYEAKIIRTSHIFSKYRDTIIPDLSDLTHGNPVDAPTFLKRSFIHLDDFACLIDLYISQFEDMPPVLHLAGSKTVSYQDFWLEVCEQFGFSKNLVHGRRIEKVDDKAKRPHNGGLDVSLSEKLGFPQFDYIGGIRKMKDES